MSPYRTDKPLEIENTLIQFGKQYQEALGYDIGILEEHIQLDVLGETLTDTFLAQIYEVAGLMKPSYSIYYQMARLINRYFDLKRNIVEVGGGVFPVLGHYLQERQLKIGKGTVTVYDPRIWLNYPTKAKLQKRYFNQSVSLSKDSLLVGMFPCEATEMLLERALKEDLEFCVALCGCNHSNDPWLSTHEYHNWLIEQLASSLSTKKKLTIAHFPKKCFGHQHVGFPILVGQKKKILTIPSKIR